MKNVEAFSRCQAILILESNTFKQVLCTIWQSTDITIISVIIKLQTSDDKFYELRNGLWAAIQMSSFASILSSF